MLWAQRADVFAGFAPGGSTILPSFHLTKPCAVLHYGGERDRLVRFKDQQQTINEIRKLNGCASHGESCGMNCTLYPSSKGVPVETFIHHFGHVYPPPVTPVIVRFFQEHSRGS